MRCAGSGGQNTRVITPLWPNVFDQLILMSRVASAAGDAGLRARVLQSIEVLERERPGVALFAAVAQQARGILERDADALLDAADRVGSRGVRFFTPVPPRTPAAN